MMATTNESRRIGHVIVEYLLQMAQEQTSTGLLKHEPFCMRVLTVISIL